MTRKDDQWSDPTVKEIFLIIIENYLMKNEQLNL